MITERCDTCYGKKTIMALGALIKECPKCKGVGHVKIEESKTITVESEVDKFIDVEIDYVNEQLKESEIKITRRGRPKKVLNEREEA